jgi:hypothetical protein
MVLPSMPIVSRPSSARGPRSATTAARAAITSVHEKLMPHIALVLDV